mmetsp:Transcript_8312/g.12456  ORF Transcript_8312/g.12456 Transcript_8312/m.12456 type:complete len:86 (+) Transcript_8312:148-405(+)
MRGISFSLCITFQSIKGCFISCRSDDNPSHQNIHNTQQKTVVTIKLEEGKIEKAKRKSCRGWFGGRYEVIPRWYTKTVKCANLKF